MRPEHYKHMMTTISAMLARSAADRMDGDVPALLAEYRQTIADQGEAKDVGKRVRWDVSYASGLSGWISDNLYGYMNDTHIDTALRRIMQEIENKGQAVPRQADKKDVMRNAARMAKRIVAEGKSMELPEFGVPHQVAIASRTTIAESDGAKRERQIHELDQEFNAPAYIGERPVPPTKSPTSFEHADRAYGESLNSVYAVLKQGGEFGTVLKIAWDFTSDDRGIAKLCRGIANNIPCKELLLQIADTLDRNAVAGEELDGTDLET